MCRICKIYNWDYGHLKASVPWDWKMEMKAGLRQMVKDRKNNEGMEDMDWDPEMVQEQKRKNFKGRKYVYTRNKGY